MATLEITDLSVELIDSLARFVDLLALTADQAVGLGKAVPEILTHGWIIVGLGEAAFEILTDGFVALGDSSVEGGAAVNYRS